MPVGRPSPDGDGIIPASRHYRGNTLGPAGPWKCPACLKQNEGAVEKGCVHCGSGDPNKSRAGGPPKPTVPAVRPDADDGAGHVRPVPPRPRPDLSEHRPTLPPATLRILRLIEYVVKPGQNADDVLRNSLVGRMEFAWGTLTATIVDSADLRQEDLLGLARRQPGVWLANPNATVLQAALSLGKVNATPSPFSRADEDRIKADLQVLEVERLKKMSTPLPPAELPDSRITPDTGISFDINDKNLAWEIIQLVGYKVAHTLAVALGSVAGELDQSGDSEKLMTSQEATQLANAILFLIPDEWLTPPAPVERQVDPAVLARIQAAQDASKPVATPWRDPNEPGATKL